VDQLPEPRKIDLIRAQEPANRLLASNDGERAICAMVEPTGSKTRQRQCREAKGITYALDSHRDGLRQQTRHIMKALPPGSPGIRITGQRAASGH